MNKFTEKARQALDKRVSKMKPYDSFGRPPKGWIRAVRDALGMTTTQLARRLGISQPSLYAQEKRECEGTLTLNTLEKTAQAMGCRLIYAIVPEDSLEGFVRNQAEKIARKIFLTVEHSMRLEQQEVSEEERKIQFEKFVETLMKDTQRLWDDFYV